MTADPALSALHALLLDHLDRIDELVDALTADLPTPVATYRPDGEANTVDWLVWHQARVLDDHGADLAGTTQVWADSGWWEETGRPYDRSATGYGQSPDEAARLVVPPAQLAGYHHDVTARLRDYLGSVDVGELERIVDTRWDPPVTASARIVSMIGDSLQHLGQASYVKGIAERAGLG